MALWPGVSVEVKHPLTALWFALMGSLMLAFLVLSGVLSESALRGVAVQAPHYQHCEARRHVGRENGDITRIGAYWHGCQQQAGRSLQAQVLERMDREINAAFQQCGIDLGGEEFLALDLRQRLIEDAVVSNIERKEREAKHMSDEMRRNIVDHHVATSRASDTYARDVATGDGWTMHLGDCVDVVAAMPSDSVHYSVFSPPFASLYTYSASPRDMGNARDHDEFYRHFGFLVRDMLRAAQKENADIVWGI